MNEMSAVANRTSPALRAGEPGAAIRRRRGEIELVDLQWGLRPKEEGDRPFTVVRAEGRAFASHRCLLPASEFHVRHDRELWRFTLADRGHFYFAGIWRPATRDWPESYAVLTTAANADVAPYRDRQMAVILRRDRMAWLDRSVPEDALLQPLPQGSFRGEADGVPAKLL